MFIGVPMVFLEQVAQYMEELEFEPGDLIFNKGDQGTSLYIVVEGRVRVHDGERTLNYLDSLEVFGEMAAIDPEPRSASVTAVQKTKLFRLERDPLFHLIAGHNEISQHIIHILCQRLRSRMRDMAEDFQYMQQFERVIAAAVALENGIYKPESLDDVAGRSDELGQLAKVFQMMAREVYLREQRLRQKVAELRIEIDEVNKARQVSEITDTEYFQKLKLKAKEIRTKRHKLYGHL
jgi:CRP/FNR family cyclic AMP-dependent transcriptional regulator